MFKKREPITQADRDYNNRHDPSVQKARVDACLDADLSAWETNFMVSIEAQLKAGRELSEKQAEVLERIYNERT